MRVVYFQTFHRSWAGDNAKSHRQWKRTREAKDLQRVAMTMLTSMLVLCILCQIRQMPMSIQMTIRAAKIYSIFNLYLIPPTFPIFGPFSFFQHSCHDPRTIQCKDPWRITVQKITSSRVLLVGAGGIGCELLKNLVMSGFPSIEVVCFSPAHKICKEFKRSNTFGRRLISTRLIWPISIANSYSKSTTSNSPKLTWVDVYVHVWRRDDNWLCMHVGRQRVRIKV